MKNTLQYIYKASVWSKKVFMSAAAASMVLIYAVALHSTGQVAVSGPAGQTTGGQGRAQTQTPASPAWPFGRPHTPLTLEGFLLRSDGDTVSVLLADERIIRLQLDSKTRYARDGERTTISSFHITDFVEVEGEVLTHGLLAHSVRFIRTASREEQAKAFQSPELMQRWRLNVLAGANMDAGQDDRKLSLVSKPDAMLPPIARDGASSDEHLISLARWSANQAFGKLPSFRATEITSLFQSFSRPVKWVPDGTVTAEIAYEEGRESYSNIHVDGKVASDAPAIADADYMRSMNKAWSTGDFETISHCMFSELSDSDFHRATTDDQQGDKWVTYHFQARSPSDCIGINYESQVIYPGYKGSMKITAETGAVLHVSLEATDIPAAFPLDRAERSVDFGSVRIGDRDYILPKTAYWFGCFRNSYSCFLNRIDFRDYRRFEADSTVVFKK